MSSDGKINETVILNLLSVPERMAKVEQQIKSHCDQIEHLSVVVEGLRKDLAHRLSPAIAMIISIMTMLLGTSIGITGTILINNR